MRIEPGQSRPRSRRAARHSRLLAVAVVGALGLAGALVAPASAATPTAAAAPDAPSITGARVVVMARPGALASVRTLATGLGVRVTRELPIIEGFAAELPTAGRAQALARLRADAGVQSVTPDQGMTPMSLRSQAAPASYSVNDIGSWQSTAKIVGADKSWAQGYTGKGVDVAVIDTGVTRVPGLDAAGKVVQGPDLSFDSPTAVQLGEDGYGHGTFMAGLIAANDPSSVPTASRYQGIAPGARIINVKVGAHDGAVDVSQVIAAVDWVTEHAHDRGFNIRVLNLSYGTDSAQSVIFDPLAHAVENAWKSGIVVVAAGGNEGQVIPNLAMPAVDPAIIAVGGEDTRNTLSIADDVVASFAQHGTFLRPVDVIAPATHVIGLRVPGSSVDSLPDNAGRVGTRFQRGSGTSEAAAIVSGVVALLLQKYPLLTPSAVKTMLNLSATSLGWNNLLAILPYFRGNGVVNASGALALMPTSLNIPGDILVATGIGSLELSRGTTHVRSTTGVDLTGDKDIFGKPYGSLVMAGVRSAHVSWIGGQWNNSLWAGDGWVADSWAGSRWAGSRWAGNDWAGSRWAGSRWAGFMWSGAVWDGSRWSGSRWSSSDWK